MRPRADLLEEANDILEGLFTSASTPWTQSRLSAGMDDVFAADSTGIARGPDAGRLFSVSSTPAGDCSSSWEYPDRADGVTGAALPRSRLSSSRRPIDRRHLEATSRLPRPH